MRTALITIALAIIASAALAAGPVSYKDAYQLNAAGTRVSPFLEGGTVDSSGSSVAVTNVPTVTVGTEPTVAQIPYLMAVTRGLVSGAAKVNKFGHNLATTTGEDVWHGGGVYGFYPTTAQAVSHDGASAADDAAGTGVQSVVYYGLDANWLLANETVATDGTTAVPLTNTYVRMFRGISGAVGAYGFNVGAMTVTNAAGTVAINIGAADGQTQHAIYTIPAGKTGYILKWAPGISDGGNAASRESAKFQLMMRPNGCAWLVKGEAECVNDGTTHFSDLYAVPSGPIAAKTDIRIHCAFASTSLGTVGRFDILLIDD